MRIQWTLASLLIAMAVTCGCGGSYGGNGGKGGGGGSTQPPAIFTSSHNTQNGAMLITLTPVTAGSVIYYTVDGSTPTPSSTQYLAPFLVASNLTLKAIAVSGGGSLLTVSTVASQTFTPNINPGALVWSDEFDNTSGAVAQPDAAVWTYDTGNSGFGNNELETYCAWNSSTSPCDPGNPNAYVGTDGYLHIVAENPGGANVYTSARMKSQGLFSFQYGRLEFRAQVPEAQGFWPAAWLLGNNVTTVSWPACGEMDVLERVNAPGSPDWNAGSIHGTGFIGGNGQHSGLGVDYYFPNPQTAGSAFHTYGMMWAPGSVQYYIDDPSNVYAAFTPSSLIPLDDSAVWPFDGGQGSFIIINVAIGGNWPGPPDGTTPFPSEMLVDYVRIYTN